MEGNVVYEVSQMLHDKNAVQKDFAEAATMMQQFLKDRYVKKIYHAVEEHQSRLLSDPPKEVQFLQAIKPFTEENQQKKMDQVIDAMMKMNTIQNIRTELTQANFQGQKVTAQSSAQDEAVHEDGVYEYDRSCMRNRGNISKPKDMTEIFMLMAVLGIL